MNKMKRSKSKHSVIKGHSSFFFLIVSQLFVNQEEKEATDQELEKSFILFSCIIIRITCIIIIIHKI